MVTTEELTEFADGIAERVPGRWCTTVDDAWGFRLALVSEQDTGVKGTVWTHKGTTEVVMEPYGVNDDYRKLPYVGKWSERITFGEFDDAAFVGFTRRMTDMIEGLRRYRARLTEHTKQYQLLRGIAEQIGGPNTDLTAADDDPMLHVRKRDLGWSISAWPRFDYENSETAIRMEGYVSREIMVAIGKLLAEWETEETP